GHAPADRLAPVVHRPPGRHGLRASGSPARYRRPRPAAAGSRAMTGAWTLPAGAIALFGALLLIGMELARPRVRRRRLAVELGVKQRDTTRSRVAGLG